VSFSGFSQSVKNEITKYNQTHKLKPVLLWQPTAEQLGTTLAANRAFCHKVSKDKRTKSSISSEILEVHSLQHYLSAHKSDAIVDKFLSTQKESSSHPQAVPPIQTAKFVLPLVSDSVVSQIYKPATLQPPRPSQHTKPAEPVSSMNPIPAHIAGLNYIVPHQSQTTTTTKHTPKRRRINVSIVNPRMHLEFCKCLQDEDPQENPNSTKGAL